jgi:lon-related putative ATP-dependent protease
MIRKGSLHAANGGFIVIDALSLLRNWDTWEALKRTIKERRITISSRAEEMDMFRFDADLKPEPIPFRCKIVLVTTPEIYYVLVRNDPDFRELFKIVATFDHEMPVDKESVSSYVAFVAMVQHKKQLPPFTKGAVARIVEEGSRYAENKGKISTQFGIIEDLIAEAGTIAKTQGNKDVSKKHVLQALAAQKERSGLLADKVYEHFLDGMKLIDTSGETVGQINALAVFQLPDGNSFGVPSKMTAQTFLGKSGFVSIEREAKLSGPIFDKAFFTIQGYLGGRYGKTQPLAVSISIAMEQSYGVDGDSASLAGTAVITSALSGIPIKQGIAITGSMNQFGQVQPIGGVQEKIEGFFRVCKARGLDKTQGVIIPAQNVQQLMLQEEILEAVRKGKFHVWAVEHVDEALKILMGKEMGEPDEKGQYPADSIHGAVQKSLKEYLQYAKDAMASSGNNPELKQ